MERGREEGRGGRREEDGDRGYKRNGTRENTRGRVKE